MNRFCAIFTVLIILLGLAACTKSAESSAQEQQWTLPVFSSIMDSFIRVPGGSITMGGPVAGSTGLVYEDPSRQTTVSPFFIAIFPVTQQEYEELMKTNPSPAKSENMQVAGVSWFDAVEYCNRLSLREGLTPSYTINGTDVIWNRDANGFRLPTEAEWEFAALAGTNTPFGGMGTAHPWGIRDMPPVDTWEWCWDWHDRYPGEAQTDPAGPASGTQRVLRGGQLFGGTYGREVRSTFRSHSPPSEHGDYFSFRVVRPSSPPPG